MPLFHPPSAVFAVLASGSTGNSSYIGDGESGVIVDCGLSARQILERLAAVGLGGAPVNAVLVTHEHDDHVRGARVLSNRLTGPSGGRVPFYMTAGTRDGLPSNARPDGIEAIRPGQDLCIGSLVASSFSVSHDTRDPVAWRVQALGWNLGVITDLGTSTSLVESHFSLLDVAILEFNHDLDLLLSGSYPWHLKQRIRGNHGHLSNSQASLLLERGSKKLRHIFLGHLSEENNRPAIAFAAAGQTLRQAGMEQVRVQVARPDQPVQPVFLSEREPD